MKNIACLVLAALLAMSAKTQDLTDRKLITRAIDSFYAAFRADNFRDMSGYVTEDINYVAPTGSWFRGRNQLQDSIQAVHEGMLKKTPIELEQVSIRMITPVVAIANLVDRMGAFYPPDGVDRGNNKVDGMRTMRTMVFVKKKGKWLLTQNQSTFIQAGF